DRVMKVASAASQTPLALPKQSAEGLKITGYDVGSSTPKLNDRPLPIMNGTYCFAISPDNSSFLIGGNWLACLFDREGKEKWCLKVPYQVVSVNVTGNNRVCVMGGSDGVIRWYRRSDKEELLA